MTSPSLAPTRVVGSRIGCIGSTRRSSRGSSPSSPTRERGSIHPSASIGPSFLIDHGPDVVTGETAIVGSPVRLYQAVTLGARRLKADGDDGVRRRFARHPIIDNDVVVYAGATIPGRVTIGRGSTIGGNVWLVEDVPPDSLVMQGEVRLHTSPSPSGVSQEVLGR